MTRYESIDSCMDPGQASRRSKLGFSLWLQREGVVPIASPQLTRWSLNFVNQCEKDSSLSLPALTKSTKTSIATLLVVGPRCCCCCRRKLPASVVRDRLSLDHACSAKPRQTLLKPGKMSNGQLSLLLLLETVSRSPLQHCCKRRLSL